MSTTKNKSWNLGTLAVQSWRCFDGEVIGQEPHEMLSSTVRQVPSKWIHRFFSNVQRPQARYIQDWKIENHQTYSEKDMNWRNIPTFLSRCRCRTTMAAGSLITFLVNPWIVFFCMGVDWVYSTKRCHKKKKKVFWSFLPWVLCLFFLLGVRSGLELETRQKHSVSWHPRLGSPQQIKTLQQPFHFNKTVHGAHQN